MIHIDEKRIGNLLAVAGKATAGDIDAILAKSRALKRLTLEETALLLCADDPASVRKIFDAAAYVKDTIYGKRVVLFAPLYISNFCSNSCLYCAFQAGNRQLTRKALTADEIKTEVASLLQRGHKRVLVVAGESAPSGRTPVDYYREAIDAVYSVQVGPHRIRRVNINCAPLSVDEFKVLKTAGIGTFQLFQETYHEETYRKVHVRGPKSDPDNRIDAIDRAFKAGIDDVGVGVLYGLYDFRFETLALMMHIEHLERTFGVGPHTISVPRIEPADGSALSRNIPHRVSDSDFKKVVAVLRLAVPYTGIILSTRETAQMRDELFTLGVSQVSAASSTSPGGYADARETCQPGTQFSLNDHRSLDEVIASIIAHGFIPSFCAACYRKERTGGHFMDLAKPGLIKEKCALNAVITLKEYLDDFASKKVKEDGYRMIEKLKAALDDEGKAELKRYLDAVDKGARDTYV